jgi:translation initiation factor 2 subunit 3
MPGDEKFEKEIDSESESESDVEEEIDDSDIPKVEVDPSNLTPLSPEVISKQVR